MESSPIVYIVEDSPDLGEALLCLFDSLKLPARYHASARAFLDACQPGDPGCLLLDVRMPGVSGLELYCNHIAPRYHLPTIMISAYQDVELVARAMKAGVFDFFTKPLDENRLIDSVYQALAEDRRKRRQYSLCQAIEARFASLGEREQQILRELVKGYSSKEIARRLHLSSRTVDTQRGHILLKMQAGSLLHLARMALACGLVAAFDEDDQFL
jgi:FixJ family two-component response regulator